MNGSRASFFRQSGWMVMATVASGVCMMAVNLVANRMITSEFVVFRKLLTVFLLLSFPAAGLQVVFAGQTSAAVTDEERRRLAHTARAVLRGVFYFWLVMAAGVFLFRRALIGGLGISNPAALWLTLMIGLSSLWLPVLRGLLQGAQNFFALGMVAVLDGAGRLLAVGWIVWQGGQAAGGMAGAFVGQVVALLFGFLAVRTVWAEGAATGMEWGSWLRRAAPLTLTFSSILFTSCFDLIYAGTVFPAAGFEPYAGAQVIGLALMMVTTPVAMVMFPKVAASAARAHRTDALRLALGTTALVAVAGALAYTLWPALPVRILFFRKPEFWPAAELVPWFGWALAPLILANVLVNNLIGRGRLEIAPWLAGIALGYGATLAALRTRLPQLEPFAAFKMVIGVLGAFSVLMFAASWVFTLRANRRETTPTTRAAPPCGTN